MTRGGGAPPPPFGPARSDREALEIALARACLGEQDGDMVAGDLRGFLDRHGVLAEDAEAILAAPRRLAVYRSLVRNGLSAVVLRMLPRTRARMNAVCDGRFDSDFARFVDDVGPRTHYVRDVPAELFAWAEPRWRADPKVPAYEASRDEPPHRDVHLIGYRDASHTVRWLELTPLAASIVDRLASGEPLGVAVERACAASAVLPATVLADIVKLLADLGARGVLLGAREL
jgi:hypothetical protein